MNILETFYILFDSDAKKLEKDTQGARKEGEKLADTMDEASKGAKDLGRDHLKPLRDGLGKADINAAKLGSTFVAMASGLVSGLLAAGGATALISGAIQRAGEIKELAQTANTLGSAIEDVDAFSRAAVRAGADAQGARDSLIDMGEAIGEALSDKESMKGKLLTELGIGLKGIDGNAKDAVTGILELAGSVEKLSRAEAIFKLKQLGITDNRTIDLLLKGRKAVQDMMDVQKEQGVVTREQAEIARQYDEQLNNTKNTMTSWGNTITALVLPYITAMLKKFAAVVEWMRQNKGFVVGFFVVLGAAALYVVTPALLAAATAAWAFLAPILAIVLPILAVAAAIALLADDIYQFATGGKSMIGDLAAKYEWFGAIVRGIGAIARNLGNIFVEAWGRSKIGIEKMWTVAKPIVDRLIAVAAEIATAWVNAQKTIWGAWGWLFEKIAKGAEWLAALNGGQNYETTRQNIMRGQAALVTAGASPLVAQTSSSISNRNSSRSAVVNDNRRQNVTVNTRATDAKGTGKAVGKALGGEMRSASANFDDGIDR